MRARIGRIDHPWRNSSSWVLLLGCIALWAVARVLTPTAGGAVLQGVWLPSCPLRSLTGIPCPFCGITTGCAWLAHGHFREAWQSNILSPLLMSGALMTALYALGFRMLGARALRPAGGGAWRKALRVLAGAGAVASWLVNLHRFALL